MKKEKYSKGDLICRENTPGETMYVILSGKVRIFMTIDAEKIELNILGSGDFCGEMCLLLKGVRTASMEALEDTEVLILNKESLLKKIQKDRQFALRMITTMAKRLKDAQGVISGLEGAKRSLEIMYGYKL